MCHRIREAMREGKFPGPMGGEGKIIEADETWIGGKEKNKHVGKRKRGNIGGVGKEAAFALVERGGKVRSFHVPEVSGKTSPILVSQVSRKSALMTDEGGQYYHAGKSLIATKRSTTAPMNMCAAMLTPTRLRAISRSSNAALSERITTSANSI